MFAAYNRHMHVLTTYQTHTHTLAHTLSHTFFLSLTIPPSRKGSKADCAHRKPNAHRARSVISYHDTILTRNPTEESFAREVIMQRIYKESLLFWILFPLTGSNSINQGSLEN